MNDRFREFVANASFLLSARGSAPVWTVCERRPLTLGISGMVWYVGSLKFNLGLLLLSDIGRGRVGREGMDKVLLVLLVDGCWKRRESRENMVIYGESLLRRWSERSGQGDSVELCRTGEM